MIGDPADGIHCTCDMKHPFVLSEENPSRRVSHFFGDERQDGKAVEELFSYTLAKLAVIPAGKAE